MEEHVSIATPDNVTLEFELAGLGSRFCAYLIDGLVIVLLIFVIVVTMLLVGLAQASLLRELLQGTSGWVTSWNIALLLFLGFLIYWGYYVFFEGLRRGSTPGKKRMGIRVVREDGLPIGFREAALRNLVRAADMLPPPCYLLGGLVMQFDRHGRRLGDMVAGTLVVVEKFEIKSDGTAGAAWAARVEQGRSRQAVTLPQGALSPNQIALIEQFIARRHGLPQERRELLAWQITEPLLPLMGEDRESLAQEPDRASHCERILLEILEMARAEAPKKHLASNTRKESALF
jgi:uncharacterized RDD family membrane protein YckC